MSKYDIEVELSDGNAFAIIGKVVVGLREAGASAEEIAAYKEDAMSSDYAHLLAVSSDWVNIVVSE